MRNLVKGQEVEIEQTGVIGEVLEKEQLDQKERDLEKIWRRPGENSLIKITILCVCNVIMLYHISTFEIFKWVFFR